MAGERSPRLRFARAAHIKQGRDFSRIRQKGERVANGCLIANWQRLSGKASSRLGVITSRKVGGAVQRSRARRLLREAFRLHQHEFGVPLELVLLARPSIAGRSFATVERDFLAVFRRAGILAVKAAEA
jgi:ribonuclease P protein component